MPIDCNMLEGNEGEGDGVEGVSKQNMGAPTRPHLRLTKGDIKVLLSAWT